MIRRFLLLFSAIVLLVACSQREEVIDLGEVKGCDAARASCSLHADDGTVVMLTLGPGLVPLKPFAVAADVSGVVPDKDSVIADFQMVGMDMGMNRYRLTHSDGAWRANVTLPVCMSGRVDWFALIEFTAKGNSYRAKFPFQTRSN